VTSTAPDQAQLSRTGRAIASGIWVCASITMLASLINGTSVFYALTHDPIGTAVGFLTALAVDACLVVVLCGDRQMQALGLTAAWGRVLRIVTLLMSLGLNCGASIYHEHYGLAVFHAFLPLLIVGMSEYGQEVILTFTRESQRREAERQAGALAVQREQQARVDAEAAKQKRIAEEEDERRRREAHQRTLTAEAEQTAAANKRAADEAERLRAATEERAAVAREVLAKPHLVVDNTRRPKTAAATVGGEQVQAWLMEQHRAGVDYQNIGPAEIARVTGAKPETCRKRHGAWKAAVARELDLIAELAEAAG
jgi:hypothetical protein